MKKSKTYIGKMLYINREVVGDKILIEDLKGSMVFIDNDIKKEASFSDTDNTKKEAFQK